MNLLFRAYGMFEREVFNMQQRFSFPSNIGRPEEVVYLNVTPRYSSEVLAGQVALGGIYHVQAELKFCEGECEREGVLIDDVDLEGKIGYFEYALPLELTLNGEETVKDFRLENAVGTILSNGVFEIRGKEVIERATKQIKVEKVMNDSIKEKPAEHKPEKVVVGVPSVEEKVSVSGNKNNEATATEETIPVSSYVEAEEALTLEGDMQNDVLVKNVTESSSGSIIDWLKLTRAYDTELIELNPVLKKQESEGTE